MTITTNYNPIDMAFTAKSNSPFILSRSIRNDNGEKYITPASMSMVLDCNADELCDTISKHCDEISHYFINNTGEEIKYNLKMKLEGWIEFLSFNCFALSSITEDCVDMLRLA